MSSSKLDKLVDELFSVQGEIGSQILKSVLLNADQGLIWKLEESLCKAYVWRILPNDAVSHCLSFFYQDDIALSLCLVSKKWQRVSVKAKHCGRKPERVYYDSLTKNPRQDLSNKSKLELLFKLCSHDVMISGERMHPIATAFSETYVKACKRHREAIDKEYNSIQKEIQALNKIQKAQESLCKHPNLRRENVYHDKVHEQCYACGHDRIW